MASDIHLYSENPEKYLTLQRLRPDYNPAIIVSVDLAKKYSAEFPGIKLLDLCAGTGNNSLLFSQDQQNLEKVVLVDINNELLKVAKNSHIKTKKFEAINSNVLDIAFNKEFNIVFSIFAYHHIPDEKKFDYLQKIKKALVPGGVVIIGEIYLEKEHISDYYTNLLNAIPKTKRIAALEEFLNETAQSKDFEYKVTKNFADTQFVDAGFEIVEEAKIWPDDDTNEGTFVQVLKLKA